MTRPLEGLVVLEFCQYLAGPWAGLRLADLGARVIKVERPKTGEACRALATKNIYHDGDSLVFHTVNRGKESFAANLKDPNDLETVRQMLLKADVLTHNFRPGVMEKLGLDYDSIKAINPKMVYASVTGYGQKGPWRDKPGQDLLCQALSGVMHLSGKKDAPPTPFGLATADGICGTHLTQGILAALVRRGRTGKGALVEVSLLESMLDMQFESLTTYLNDGNQLPSRSGYCAGHPYQGAPYGVYTTTDGHLVMAMGCLEKLSKVLGVDLLAGACNSKAAFKHGDAIRQRIGAQITTQTTQAWLDVFEAQGIWCAPVMDYESLRQHPAYQVLQMEQAVTRQTAEGQPVSVKTLRSPIRIDGKRLVCQQAAPYVGQHNSQIQTELAQ